MSRLKLWGWGSKERTHVRCYKELLRGEPIETTAIKPGTKDLQQRVLPPGGTLALMAP